MQRLCTYARIFKQLFVFLFSNSREVIPLHVFKYGHAIIVTIQQIFELLLYAKHMLGKTKVNKIIFALENII